MHNQLVRIFALIVIGCLLISCTASLAWGQAFDPCVIQSAYARYVMEGQNGVSIEVAYRQAQNDTQRRIVKMAYSRPRFHTSAFKLEEIDMLATRVFTGCVEGERQ